MASEVVAWVLLQARQYPVNMFEVVASQFHPRELMSVIMSGSLIVIGLSTHSPYTTSIMSFIQPEQHSSAVEPPIIKDQPSEEGQLLIKDTSSSKYL